MLVVLVDRYAVLPQLLGDFSTLRFSFMIGNVILWDFYGGLQFNHSRNIETGAAGRQSVRFQFRPCRTLRTD
jgi:hypothetical protein